MPSKFNACPLPGIQGLSLIRLRLLLLSDYLQVLLTLFPLARMPFLPIPPEPTLQLQSSFKAQPDASFT